MAVAWPKPLTLSMSKGGAGFFSTLLDYPFRFSKGGCTGFFVQNARHTGNHYNGTS